MSPLLALAASSLSSWALLGRVAPRQGRAALTAPLALAFFSLTGTLQFLWRVPPAATDGALLLAALLFAARRRGKPEPARAWNSGADQPRWALLFVFAAALALLALVEHLRRYPDGGADAFIIWNLRARWLARAGAEVRSAFSPELLYWAHADYPLLLPSMVARGFVLLGRESPAVPAMVALLFAAGALAATSAGAPSGRRLLSALFLVTTPAFVMLAPTEQADVPLATFLAAAAAALACREGQGDLAFAAAGAVAGIAAWTKNEGAALLLLLLIAVALDERRLKAVLSFALGAFPFLLLLAAFKLQFAPPNDLLAQSIGGALRNLRDPQRWIDLAVLVPRRLVLLQVWGIHLVAVLAALLFVRSRPPPRMRWLSWVPAAWILSCLGILLVQPHDVTWMFKVTIDRLLIEVWPMAIVLLSHREWAVAAPG